MDYLSETYTETISERYDHRVEVFVTPFGNRYRAEISKVYWTKPPKTICKLTRDTMEEALKAVMETYYYQLNKIDSIVK
jgi:hypothetical protein